MKDIIQPVQSGDRILSLDLLRGVAVLGILMMNIQSFSMPEATYLNPMAFGDFSGADKWIWILSHVFADQKFMTVFSILFGAGIILVTQKAEAKSGKSAGLHYRRSFWLLIIGLIHAHLIWYGDILVTYALCAFIAYLFRKKKPSILIILGLSIMSIHTIIYLFFGLSMPYWPVESVDEMRSFWSPSTSTVESEIAAITGSISEQLTKNSEQAFMLETSVFFMVTFWRALGLMLIGMAIFKTGFVTGEKSLSFYKRIILMGLLIGLPIILFGIYQNLKANFVVEYSMFLGSQFNYWGSLFIALSYISAILLWSKSSMGAALKKRLEAVGQMALTNYLAQSIICVIIFFGIGFGLFGSVDRGFQIIIILGIWALQVIWSKPWLERYYFGPFEWMWRSLTYRKLQKFQKK